MIYGTSNVHTVRDLTDLIGIRTLILRQYWQATSTNPTQDELDAMKPATPSVPGGVLLMGEQTSKERGRYSTIWTFQGINGDGKGVTFKSRGKSIDYGFEQGFAQVPIHFHREFKNMLEEFGGYPGNDGTTVIWPRESPSGSRGGGLSLNRTAPEMNPMFGMQAFFQMEGIYRYRYAELKVPKELNQGVEYIADTLPGEPPPVADDRNWLKATPTWERKGLIYDITEYYWLSRRGGWPEPIYRKGYFKK